MGSDHVASLNPVDAPLRHQGNRRKCGVTHSSRGPSGCPAAARSQRVPRGLPGDAKERRARWLHDRPVPGTTSAVAGPPGRSRPVIGVRAHRVRTAPGPPGGRAAGQQGHSRRLRQRRRRGMGRGRGHRRSAGPAGEHRRATVPAGSRRTRRGPLPPVRHLRRVDRVPPVPGRSRGGGRRFEPRDAPCCFIRPLAPGSTEREHGPGPGLPGGPGHAGRPGSGRDRSPPHRPPGRRGRAGSRG